MTAVTSIMRVQQLLLARVEDALKPYGLTFAVYEALRLLAFTRRGSLPMGKLGAWYLLILLSFVLVTIVHPPRAPGEGEPTNPLTS